MGLAPLPTLSPLTPLAKPLQPSFFPIRLKPCDENAPEQSGFIDPSARVARRIQVSGDDRILHLGGASGSEYPSAISIAIIVTIRQVVGDRHIVQIRRGGGLDGIGNNDTPAVILGAVAAYGHIP